MNILELFEPVKVFVFDIDGVLTDGMLHVQEDGELLRRMNIKDGYALQLAVKKGYKVWIISGGKTNAVKQRLNKLGVEDVYIAVDDKITLLNSLIEKGNYPSAALLYMGDDMPDVKAMMLCGLRTCPADAVAEVKAVSQYISPLNGGYGCARDVIEKVLKINGDWE
ncbi:HAD-IIIA family hydrolase [Taibaiella lutea]|uniref:HAD-IIIA family hydrolase n=1 Tax=Taibaiella lutea TaxID=2608001 RepID=A0A5M6CEK7_9BACT|nr:HAD-IIIA family hydrolase [Taibaiella lutea]KAA5532322.1 HAD-IIIA family hydrolase [Taibaiella lutea]